LKKLIVCVSKYYGNTMKIAQVIASTLEAEVKKPNEISDLSDYSLIGFGSGIYFGKHDSSLFELINKLPKNEIKTFIFSTRGRNILFEKTYHKALREKLTQKNYTVIGEFSCRAFSDYYKIFRYFGGVNKGHPNKQDLEKAKNFSLKLLKIQGVQ
jgi:flavodoxin